MTDQSIAQIARSVRELTGLAQDLSSDLQVQIQKLRRLYRWLGALVTALGLLAVFTASEVAEHERLAKASVDLHARILENQQNIADLQRKTSNEVLCPLYGIFLDSYSPSHPQALENPKLYERSFKVIEAGAATLGCLQVTRRNRSRAR